MTRQFSGDKLVIASHNPGKVIEIRDLLGNFDIEIISAADFGLPEPEETSLTFNENAELKARAAALGSHLPALADDSGLSVAALDGDPGIYSARWAGPDKDFALAMKKVMDALSNKGGNNMDKGAKFVCALSLCWPDGHCETVEGVVQGQLQFPPRGDKGYICLHRLARFPCRWCRFSGLSFLHFWNLSIYEWELQYGHWLQYVLNHYI